MLGSRRSRESGYRNTVSAVAPGSPAQRAGVRPGDWLVSLNGHQLRDAIDAWFYGADEQLTLVTRRDGADTSVTIDKDPDEPLGVEFTEPVFDGLWECNNDCPFCFIKGVPPGLRETLYLRDDDYRYSFLFGTFVTLTNLDPLDWDRLAEQRLGPLNVSVHATDPALRGQLLGRPKPVPVLPTLKRLGALGIRAHTQVVLCPGANDGAALDQTLGELGELYPTVEAISVVPVGLSDHSPRETRFGLPALRPLTPDEAAAAIDQVAAWQKTFRREHGVGLAYAADELFLLAGRPLPKRSYYDDFLMIDNGVGGLRRFQDGWRQAAKGLERRMGAVTSSAARQSNGDPIRTNACRVILTCGTLMAAPLAAVADDLRALCGLDAEVVVAPNALFGAGITATGLVPGQGVIDALRSRPGADVVIVPRAMLDASGERFLDGVTVADVAAACGADVRVISTPAGVAGLAEELALGTHAEPKAPDQTAMAEPTVAYVSHGR